MKGPFPLHNGRFFFLKKKIRSHANRRAHRDDVQTCNSVRCQRSILPNSPLVLHSISRHHRPVNLAKSSAVGLAVCSPRSSLSHVTAQVENHWFQTKTSQEAHINWDDSPMGSIKGHPDLSYLRPLNPLWRRLSYLVISRIAVPPTVLCTSV